MTIRRCALVVGVGMVAWGVGALGPVELGLRIWTWLLIAAYFVVMPPFIVLLDLTGRIDVSAADPLYWWGMIEIFGIPFALVLFWLAPFSRPRGRGDRGSAGTRATGRSARGSASP